MSSKINSVLSAWRLTNLTETQNSLDETASQIAQYQDECEASRKKLVELLKEFKGNASEDCRMQAGNIIRSFQAEVDRLNKRCKYSESAFLKSYQQFLEMVDPVSILEHCLLIQKKAEKVDDQQIEIDALRMTINEYKEEFKDIRSQDITIKNLREKIKTFEDEMEQLIEKKCMETERKFQDQFTQKENLILEEHSRAMKKLEESECKQKILQQSLEQSQSELFDSKVNHDDSTMAKTDTMEILINDLDRLTQQNMSLQKQISELHEQSLGDADKQKIQVSSINQIEIASLESELKAKNREIEQLITDMNRMQNILKDMECQGHQRISSLEEALSESCKKVEELQETVNLQHDYEEIKKELLIIKSVEFDQTKTTDKTLEGLLLEKNRVLQNENTTLKVKTNSLSDALISLESRIQELTDQNNQKTILIGQLESDVLRMQDNRNLFKEQEPSQLSLLSTAVNDIEPLVPDQTGMQANAQNSESVLSIVSAQRERFRVRNEELESEIIMKNNHILSIQGEVDSLRNDNLKLYEKIKFLQSFDGRRSNSDATTEQRYNSQYENSLDPFSSFSQKERQRKYASLSPFEKMTLFFGRFILQSKGARTAAFFYLVFVHCLIFFVLFVMANTESCKREVSSNCAQMFKEHMHDVHGNNDFNIA